MRFTGSSSAGVRHGRRYVVILAAGASRRLARPKALVQLRGEPLVRDAARRALAAAPAGCIVVLGARASRVAVALQGLPVVIARNRAWRRGQAASIACGILALPYDASHALVVAVDQWAVSARMLARLLAGAGRIPLAAAYAGGLGIPVVFPRAWFARLRTLTGDRGARALLAGASAAALALPEAAYDLDTAADLSLARQRARRREIAPHGRA